MIEIRTRVLPVTVAALTAIAGLSACGSATSMPVTPAEQPAAQDVPVEVLPRAAAPLGTHGHRGVPAVQVTPNPGAVDGCMTLQFTATVLNATNRAVTWTVQEGTAGGTISTSGLYTAPANAGTYHVVATSVQDPTQTFVAAVTVSDHILSVSLSPSTVTLQPGQTQLFTATLTTTCGSTVSSSSVTAPL